MADDEHEDDGSGDLEAIQKFVRAGQAVFAGMPGMAFEFGVTRGEGATGLWNGRFAVVLGGQRHGGRLDDADDSAMLFALSCMGRYVARMLKTDEVPGTPKWRAEEREAAAAFAAALGG